MGGNTFRRFGGPPVAVIGSEDGHHEVSCFADEVVVDFPSMAPAIDRIRSAFLAGERGAAFDASIRSRRAKPRLARSCRSKSRYAACATLRWTRRVMGRALSRLRR
jgi:hypothetical protein